MVFNNISEYQMKSILNLTLIFIFIAASALSQHQLKLKNIGDLPLSNGEVIENCEIGYRTFGQLNDDSSNVIIFPTWFGGTSGSLNNLITNHNFVDTTEFFIIAIDALGNEVSSSPSNYDGDFPRITIRDMVNSQYILLTEHLGFDKIYGAVGGSMGSMQLLEWAVAYPDYIKKILPYAATPRLSSYDLLQMNFRKELIEAGKSHNLSDSLIYRLIRLQSAMNARTPDYIVENTPSKHFTEYFKSFDKEPSKTFTVDNYYSQLVAMINHDITRNYHNSYKAVDKRINADIFMIVSETDHLLHPKPAMEFGDSISAEIMLLNNNCGHLAPGCEMEKTVKAIHKFFKK